MRFRTWKSRSQWVVEVSPGLLSPWSLLSTNFRDSHFDSLEEAEKAIIRYKRAEEEYKERMKNYDRERRDTMRYY